MHCVTRGAVALGCFLCAAGCYGPLDAVGVEEINTELESRQGKDSLEDDRIEDKHPEYDPDRTVTEVISNCEMKLNKSGSVTKLDTRALDGDDAALDGKLFATRGAALKALGDRVVIPSMEVVNGALKPLNDGLYAAVELAAEDGSDGAAIDKRAVFDDVLRALVSAAGDGAEGAEGAADAAVQWTAAAMLGGQAPDEAEPFAGGARALIALFDDEPLRSRPIGLYDWTPALGAVFRRDRFLQSTGIPRGAYVATARVLDADPDLRERYADVLDLYAGLTNPLFDASPLDLVPFLDAGSTENVWSAFAASRDEADAALGDCGPGVAMLPASDSPESRLYRALYCYDSPDGNLIDVLIARIRAGDIDLTPTKESGWYDRQLHALETLLLPETAPETDHLLLTRRYKEKLVETFKSLITQYRETHVKQLGASDIGGSASDGPIDLHPNLVVEPFPTFYLRTARGYVFLREILRASLGDEFLRTAHRMTEHGKRHARVLDDELGDAILLLYGLHAISTDSIGAKRAVTAEEREQVDMARAVAVARQWLGLPWPRWDEAVSAAYTDDEREASTAGAPGWRSDEDLLRDPRVIVPLHHDIPNHQVRVWAIAGVRVMRVRAEFVSGYEPKVASGCQVKRVIPHEPYTLIEEMIEAAMPDTEPPPTRDEFRALADDAETADDLRTALEAR